MSRKITPPSYDDLYEMYSKSNVSISEVARRYNTSNPTVRKWLNEYGIERKSHRDICRTINSQRKATRPSFEVFKTAYENNTIKDLEQIFHCGQETIYQWVDYYGMERKSLSEAVRTGKQKQYQDIQFSKEEIEQVYNRYHHYQLAADELGISVSHFRKLKAKYDIDTVIPWRSKAEIELFEYVQTLDPDCRANDKSPINPYELDIVSDKYSFAIEYCGLYWHSEYHGNKDRDYHRMKYLKCKEKGYTLYTVFETDDIEKIKRLLYCKMANNNSVGARKTKVVNLSPEQARDFHNKYHMHGSIGGGYHYGLVYNDQIVLAVSFHKSRFNQQYEYECGRCTGSDIRVNGGVSKLFSHFIHTVRPKSIITYSDLRFGDGDCYLNCGMTRQDDTSVNYWYFHKHNPSELFSRVKFQKHKLKDRLSVFDETLTEFENMTRNGWDRVWDCGNAKYVWESVDHSH